MKKIFEKLKLICKDILIFLGYMFIMTIMAIILNYNSNNLTPLKELIIYIILSIYLFLVFRKQLISSFKDFKKNYKNYLKNGFKVYFLSYALMIVVQSILYTVIGVLPANEVTNQAEIRNNIILSIITMCIIAPFQEELLFRQNFKNLFKNKIAFSIITGLIFGSMHLISSNSLIELPYIITYSIMGFSLGYIYFDTDNIYTSMALHSFNNTFSLIITLIEAYV